MLPENEQPVLTYQIVVVLSETKSMNIDNIEV